MSLVGKGTAPRLLASLCVCNVFVVPSSQVFKLAKDAGPVRRPEVASELLAPSVDIVWPTASVVV